MLAYVSQEQKDQDRGAIIGQTIFAVSSQEGKREGERGTEREGKGGEERGTERGGTDSFFYKDKDIYLFVRVATMIHTPPVKYLSPLPNIATLDIKFERVNFEGHSHLPHTPRKMWIPVCSMNLTVQRGREQSNNVSDTILNGGPGNERYDDQEEIVFGLAVGVVKLRL